MPAIRIKVAQAQSTSERKIVKIIFYISPLKLYLYDDHFYQSVTEMDHQFMKESHIFIDIPVTAHVTFGRYIFKITAPAFKHGHIFKREKCSNIAYPGLF